MRGQIFSFPSYTRYTDCQGPPYVHARAIVPNWCEWFVGASPFPNSIWVSDDLGSDWKGLPPRMADRWRHGLSGARPLGARGFPERRKSRPWYQRVNFLGRRMGSPSEVVLPRPRAVCLVVPAPRAPPPLPPLVSRATWTICRLGTCLWRGV